MTSKKRQKPRRRSSSEITCIHNSISLNLFWCLIGKSAWSITNCIATFCKFMLRHTNLYIFRKLPTVSVVIFSCSKFLNCNEGRVLFSNIYLFTIEEPMTQDIPFILSFGRSEHQVILSSHFLLHLILLVLCLHFFLTKEPCSSLKGHFDSMRKVVLGWYCGRLVLKS